MAKTLFILNDPPYGTERSYNALRLAGALSKREGEAVKVFLIGDAASCAKSHQKVPEGYYNLDVMLKSVATHGGEIGVRDLHGCPRNDRRRARRRRAAQHTREAHRLDAVGREVAGVLKGFSMTTTPKAGLSTRCIHAGDRLDERGGIHMPLYNHSTFAFPSAQAVLDVVEGRATGNL